MARDLLDGEIRSSPSLTTVAAINIMGKREAAYGEANVGWLYSGL